MGRELASEVIVMARPWGAYFGAAHRCGRPRNLTIPPPRHHNFWLDGRISGRVLLRRVPCLLRVGRLNLARTACMMYALRPHLLDTPVSESKD